MADISDDFIDEIRMSNDFLRSSIESQFEYYDKSIDSLDNIAEYLKDLVNFMKSGNSAEASNESAKGMSSSKKSSVPNDSIDFTKLGDALPKLTKGLLDFKKVETHKFTAFLRNMTNAMTLDGDLKNPKDVKELYTGISDVFDSLGGNLTKMGFGFMIFGVSDKMGGPESFLKFLDKFLSKDRLSFFKSDEIKQVGDSLNALGSGIFKFSFAIAIATPLLILGIPALLLLIPMLKLTQFTMSMLGDDIERIQEGGKAISYISGGLLLFTASLVMTRLLQPTDFLMGLGLIVLFSTFIGVVFLMNKIGGEKQVNAGSDSIMYFGVALISVTLSLLITRFVQWEDIFKGVLIISLLTGVSILLGIFKGVVSDGAKSLLFISASLIVAVIGILATRLVEWEDIGKAGAIIGGLTISALLLGLVGSVAIKGAIALIIISASLIVASIGISMVSKHEWEDIGKAGAIIGGLGAAAVLLGLSGPIGILGAVTMLIMGMSLVVIGNGISRIMSVDFDDKKSKTFITLLRDLSITMVSIGLGSLFLIPGIAASIGMGVALIAIGNGLLKFSELNLPLDELCGKDGTIYKTLTSVMEPFKQIGKENSIGGGFLNLGGSNPVAVGIKSVRGVGSVLVDIAKGVQAFANLTYTDANGKVVQLDDATMVTVQENIRSTIGVVGDVFAELGESGGEVKWWSNNKIQSGIKSIRGAGSNLVDIAKGVQEFANLTFKDSSGNSVPITPDMLGPEGTVSQNIHNVITSISNALGLIGSSDNAQGNWWRGKSAIDKGKKAIDGVGANILDIVNVAKGIQELTSKGNFDSEAMSKHIQNIIAGMSNGLSSVGKIESHKDIASSFSTVSKGLVDMAKNSEGLTKSATAIEKISNALAKTFDGINGLADDKLTKLKEFFEYIVEVEKFNAESFESKINSYRDIVESAKGINIQSGANITTNQDNQTSNIKLEQKLDDLGHKFDQMIGILSQVSSSLKKPLAVDIIDSDIQAIMNGR